MQTFGKGYREVLSSITKEELVLLRKAYARLLLGGKMNYYLSASLVNTMSASKEPVKLHKLYPHIFDNPNVIKTIEQATKFGDTIFKI